MKKQVRILSLLLAAALLLTGCAMRTVDEMYSPPKRSDEFNNLQSAIDSVIGSWTYCAPLTGENQQTVQMADLNGDGVQEFLLFAKGSGEKPLKIMIFQKDGEAFRLRHTIESSGSAFEQVEYVQMDSRPGYELVVGRQVSDQVLRSVCVYNFSGSEPERLIVENYAKFLTCDLNRDRISELLILTPGQTETDNGVAKLLQIKKGSAERSPEVEMSEPVDHLKRIMVSQLHDGVPAVYVASQVDENTLTTDVFAMAGKHFINVTLSNESGTHVQTQRNYYVYGSDIDNDGEMELPDLIPMRPVRPSLPELQYLIRWYTMTIAGLEVDKLYTYHDFDGKWYFTLDQEWARRVSVIKSKAVRDETQFDFYIWDESWENPTKVLSIFILNGENRIEAASQHNRFILHKTDMAVYAAKLEGASASYAITQELVESCFHMIHMDWKTGET